MNRRRGVLAGGGLLVGLLLASPACATEPGKCRVISEVSSTAGNAANEILATASARVCQVELTTTGANGFAQIYDRSTTTQTAANIAEPSAATSGNHAVVDFGEVGYVTEQGLGVFVHNGRVRVRWGR